MEVSFISTFFNEEDSISQFLDSLFSQTLLPEEIVLVDAFSKDKTFNIVKKNVDVFKKNNTRVKIRILKKKGNRSVGRNYAIQNSKGDIIAVSDAGCTLDNNWLKNILEPLKNKKADVVAGFYKPITETAFEKCLSTYTCVPEDKVTKDFLPSSRSIAFKKEAWKKGGEYPEKLDTCEDLVFARNMKRQDLKFAVNKKAIVLWPQKKNIIEAFGQFYSYAKGDGQALYFRRQTPLLVTRYLIGICLVITAIILRSFFIIEVIILLIFFYSVWAILKNYKYVKQIAAIIYLPLLQFVSDIAVITGMLIGLITRKKFYEEK